MVGEAEAHGSEFGIVRVVSRDGDNGITNTGCTVTVESVTNRYPDGRFDIVTRGQRRFRVTSLNDEEPCLRGEVEYFADGEAEPVPVELVNRALEAYERLGEASPEIDRARHDLSFRLAEPIDDLDFRSLMLQSRSELERLKMFTDFVDGYISRRDYVALMKKKAPTNGSGHKRPGV